MGWKGRFFLGFVLLTAALLPTEAREYLVRGPQGGLACEVRLPDGFDPDTDRCPMVILMHGIFSSKDFTPIPALARELAARGIASIRFDFDGHGRSEGRMQDMTIARELADARAVWDYVRTLPYVRGIGLLGHSQGGVIASMLAGQLAAEGDAAPDALVLARHPRRHRADVVQREVQRHLYGPGRADPRRRRQPHDHPKEIHVHHALCRVFPGTPSPVREVIFPRFCVSLQEN